jgi:hypothetical protein
MEKEKAIGILQAVKAGTADAFIRKATINDALDLAISALEKQEQERWHSVAKEGNPPKTGRYIVVDNGKMDGAEPHTRCFNARGDASFWSGWGADEVIAWRPLPEPYTEEESCRKEKQSKT